LFGGRNGGYLSKPIRAVELDEILERFMTLKTSGEGEPEALLDTAPTAEPETIDQATCSCE
jgi:hypothetical protein